MANRTPKKRRSKKQNKTPDEILLLYQIKNKEEELQEIIYREKLLNEENILRSSEIKQLKYEQERILSNAVLEDKLEKEDNSRKINYGVDRNDVIKQLNKNIALQEQFKEEIKEIIEANKEKDQKIEKIQKEIKNWEYFRDAGQFEMKGRIDTMERWKREEDERYSFITDQLKKKSKDTIEQMNNDTVRTILNLNLNAAKQTVREMNRTEKQTLYDNEWLLKEIELQEKELCRLNEEIEMQTQQNLDLLSEFKSKHGKVVEEIPIFKSFYDKYLKLEKNSEVGENQMKVEIRKKIKSNKNKNVNENEEKGEEGGEKDNNSNNYLTHPSYEQSVQINLPIKYRGKKENIDSEIGLDKHDREVNYEDEIKEETSEWPITGGMIRRKLKMK